MNLKLFFLYLFSICLFCDVDAQNDYFKIIREKGSGTPNKNGEVEKIILESNKKYVTFETYLSKKGYFITTFDSVLNITQKKKFKIPKLGYRENILIIKDKLFIIYSEIKNHSDQYLKLNLYFTSIDLSTFQESKQQLFLTELITILNPPIKRNEIGEHPKLNYFPSHPTVYAEINPMLSSDIIKQKISYPIKNFQPIKIHDLKNLNSGFGSDKHFLFELSAYSNNKDLIRDSSTYFLFDENLKLLKKVKYSKLNLPISVNVNKKGELIFLLKSNLGSAKYDIEVISNDSIIKTKIYGPGLNKMEMVYSKIVNNSIHFYSLTKLNNRFGLFFLKYSLDDNQEKIHSFYEFPLEFTNSESTTYSIINSHTFNNRISFVIEERKFKFEIEGLMQLFEDIFIVSIDSMGIMNLSKKVIKRQKNLFGGIFEYTCSALTTQTENSIYLIYNELEENIEKENKEVYYAHSDDDKMNSSIPLIVKFDENLKDTTILIQKKDVTSVYIDGMLGINTNGALLCNVHKHISLLQKLRHPCHLTLIIPKE